MSAPPTDAPAAKPPYKFGALDYLRLALTLVVLIFAPMVGLISLDASLGAFDVPGWFWHLLVTVPATAVCAAVLWTPLWLLWRGSPAGAIAVIYAVIYTPIMAWHAAASFNVALDRDPGRAVQVRYVRRQPAHKGPTADVVTSWSDPADTVSLYSLPLGGELATPGAVVPLVVHRGAFGLEWVELGGGAGR